jgi:hypothetical protein
LNGKRPPKVSKGLFPDVDAPYEHVGVETEWY